MMEWTIKLEARTGWGEVTTCEIGALRRSLGDLTADGVGLSLACPTSTTLSASHPD